MNVETGAVYRLPKEIEAAAARGENLVHVSERVANAVEIGMSVMNRAERRKEKRDSRRAKTKAHRPNW